MWIDAGESKRVRLLMRSGAVLLLAATIAHAMIRGGHFEYEGSPWPRIPGQLSSLVGLAADDIKIHGLTHHEPEAVLTPIGVTPGASLANFDAAVAKRILENLDWVQSATVQRVFPNQLEVTVVERDPFAVWQRDGAYYVIDRSGAAMSGIPAADAMKLPLVTGEGANAAAEELVNQLEAYPGLMSQVKAAARVGDRRWTLYLDSGITVLLPEQGVDLALSAVQELDRSQKLLSKGIRSVDLRVAGRVTVAVAEAPEGAEPETAAAR